jgi:tetratricopeptide (TPR) repeat protein
LTLGAPLKALASHESALKLDPDHPAALLGAAEALTASAGAYIAEGALAAAAGELGRAAELAGRCAAKNGALVSAWKQLGDVLLLARNAPPEAGENGGGSGAAVAAWRGRVTAVQRARRAYLKALHLRPSSAPAWHDVACAFYHESQLQRAHSAAANAGATAPPAALRTAAEACLRGALRLDPSSAELWAALGVTCTDRTAAEYCLSRSLQLEPRESSAWVALARLYIDAGERSLAERCLQQGRSQDPAVATIWEAMAALAALGDGPAAARERADFNEHAVGLGAGAEGLLGYAQAALAGGKTAAGAGDAYAAACRAATLDPLNPAALNVWGLACEAKSDAVGAVKAYKTALELLPGALGAELSQRHPAATPAGLSVETALKINLARALVSAGQPGEAVDLYGELEFEGVLESQAPALLAYAVARAATGDASGAGYSASAALEAAGDDGPTVAAAGRVLAMLAVAEGRPGDVLGVLRSNLPRLSETKTPADDVKELWRAAMAAAAVAGSGADEVAAEARRWAAAADQEDADFFAELQTLAGTAAAVAGGADAPRATLSAHSKALHLSPWSAEARSALADATSDATQGYAPAVLRLLRCGGALGPAALATAAAALLDRGIAAWERAAREQARALSHAIHERPTDGQRWYLAALVAAQVAAAEPTAAAHKTALSLATCALALTNDIQMQAKLLICVSEGRLRSREPETRTQALAAAQEAVQRAPASTEALRQVARCHWPAGDVQKAQAFFTRAMEAAAAGGDAAAGAISAMELAACLEAGGRGRDAAEVLAEEAARLQAADAAAPPPALRAAAAQRQGMVQQVLLQRALALARLGDLDAAKAAADAATPVEESAARGLGLVAAGAVRLQQALAVGADSESGAALIGESRRLLSEALQKGQDSVVSRALLARLEAAGTMRKKEERVAAHAAEALRLADRPAPAPLVELLGRLQGSKTMCAKALHSEPWRAGWWAGLQQV